MGTRIQIRRDTSTNWSVNNPVLALGEPGLETDTQIVKYGDGVTAWNSLPYSNLNSLADFTTADLVEETNLYYTNARVYANVINLGIYASNNQLSLYATNSQLGSYATNVQLATYATISNINSKANVADLTTSNVTEGTNLYYSNTKVQNYLEDPTTYIVFNAPFRVPRMTYDVMQTQFASNGQIVFETSNNVFRGYNGTTWTILG